MRLKRNNIDNIRGHVDNNPAAKPHPRRFSDFATLAGKVLVIDVMIGKTDDDDFAVDR
ncbi:hypothetical protein PQR63_02005 [Herbaspirillum rhizosphaerae]|uniref:Uncharacterized protein n=1 Tax=Herbaspirillum rhizosphaerae TaxID=346179 RepID=A0ABW8Z3T1_9BURK